MAAKINQRDLEDLILHGSRSWTYQGLCTNFNADPIQAMQIDRTLQKLRRKGLIKMERVGKLVHWSAVPVASEDAL
jgi:hypothetical protein